MRNTADIATDHRRWQLIEFKAIDTYRAIGRSIKSHQQLLEGRFTRPNPADNRHLFARLNAQIDIVQRAGFHSRIFEGDIFEFNATGNHRMMDILLAFLLLTRGLHDFFQNIQCRFGLVITGRQHGELHHRRNGAAGEHHGSNHPPHGNQTFGDLVNTDDHQTDRHHLLDITGQ